MPCMVQAVENLDLIRVRENWRDLEHVVNQTEEICLAAVTYCGWALMYVRNQTDAICIAAIRQDPEAFEHVRVQTEAICLFVVSQAENAVEAANVLEHINNEYIAACEAWLEDNPF